MNHTLDKSMVCSTGSMPASMPIAEKSADTPRPRKPVGLTARHRRILLALLAGKCSREQIDRIAGASNGPDEILRLRRLYGLQIPCTRKGSKDRDGQAIEFGTYSLAERDRIEAQRLLALTEEDLS